MGCGCGGRASANKTDTLGYYVILPGGGIMPDGFNPETPEAGEPPYFSVVEARREVTLSGGGTIKRAKRKPVAA